MPENGNEQEQQPELDHLLLTYNRRTLLLELTGDAHDRLKSGDPRGFDLVLGMLTQAHRHIEVQFRIVAGLQAQLQQKQAQEEFNRVERLLGKR